MSQSKSAIIDPAAIGKIMAKPRKMDLYIADGKRLKEAVEALRAARDKALLQSAQGCVDCNQASAEEPVTQKSTPVENCNKPVPTKPKRKSYPLAPLDRPSEIPGFPLRDPGQEIPGYGNISWAPSPSTRATMAERRGKRAAMTPTGPSGLRTRKKS
jgi:hypothetical protein